MYIGDHTKIPEFKGMNFNWYNTSTPKFWRLETQIISIGNTQILEGDSMGVYFDPSFQGIQLSGNLIELLKNQLSEQGLDCGVEDQRFGCLMGKNTSTEDLFEDISVQLGEEIYKITPIEYLQLCKPLVGEVDRMICYLNIYQNENDLILLGTTFMFGHYVVLDAINQRIGVLEKKENQIVPSDDSDLQSKKHNLAYPVQEQISDFHFLTKSINPELQVINVKKSSLKNLKSKNYSICMYFTIAITLVLLLVSIFLNESSFDSLQQKIVNFSNWMRSGSNIRSSGTVRTREIRRNTIDNQFESLDREIKSSEIG